MAKEALRAGGLGDVMKHSPSSEIVKAIRQVLHGRIYLSPLVTKEVLESFIANVERPEDLPPF